MALFQYSRAVYWCRLLQSLGAQDLRPTGVDRRTVIVRCMLSNLLRAPLGCGLDQLQSDLVQVCPHLF